MTKWEGRGRISSIKIDQAADGVEPWEICKTALIDRIKNSLKCNKTNRFLVLGRDGVADPANTTSILGCWRINGVCLGNILVFLMENTSTIKGLLYIRGLWVGRVELSNSQHVFCSLIRMPVLSTRVLQEYEMHFVNAFRGISDHLHLDHLAALAAAAVYKIYDW